MRRMADENNPHRRSSSRVPLQAMITYRLDGQEYGNLAADVSPDGIFIRTFMPPAIGTQLELTVRLPQEYGAWQVELEGTVRRRVDGEDPRNNGMGVQFTALHATEPAAVRFLVSQIFGCDVPADSDEFDQGSDPMDDGDTVPEG